MHLKSLTLKGFKSFASATTLAFEPGVTCVVGPNGSGKSNIVDALAWVMGEQGAKSLRGGAMADVIFAGTTGRAPLGRAEVALTIDNTDGALPIEYTEVTISRTLFRNGGSEYAINGTPCRLLDVQELLSDSGIGREMHVIVGQGQLDTILHATPEDRRGFIEEAAGVLKHRKRKEKALRKLEAMQGNLTRLTDLTTELRRQLKPLGRQAEVARRAATIQAEARDSRLRLLADDLMSFRTALAAEVADETALRERRQEVEVALAATTAREVALEADLQSDAPLLVSAQETWFGLSALRERLLGTASLAAERLRLITPEVEDDVQAGRDPEALETEASAVREEERVLVAEVATLQAALAEASRARQAAEQQHAAEERRVQQEARAAADRREGLARLSGRVAAARSRLEARSAEIERLAGQREDARARAAEAQRDFTALESQVAGLDAGERGLDTDYERTQRALAEAEARVEALRGDERDHERERAALTARLEALRLSLSRGDGPGALLRAGETAGVVGSVASMLAIEPGCERAVAAALGPLSDAVVVRDAKSAIAGLMLLHRDAAGRAAVLVLDGSAASAPAARPAPAGARWVTDAVDGPRDLLDALRGRLGDVALVDSLDAAASLRASGITVVTRDGDLITATHAIGGSGEAPTLLEIQAAVDDAERAFNDVQHRLERTRFELAAAIDAQRVAADDAEGALARLHESDAQLAAIAEQLGLLGQAARAATAEADRLASVEQAALEALAADEATLAELEVRLAAAQGEQPTDELPDRRVELSALAEQARAHEVEARLAVRTGEERQSSLAARAEALERAAHNERATRRRAIERREQRAREAEVASAVARGVDVVLRRLEMSLTIADSDRRRLEEAQAEREREAQSVRARLRELGAEMERLTDSVHRDEVARAEQRLRIEQLESRVIEEFGIDPDALVAEYGPDQLVPPTPPGPDEEIDPAAPVPEPYPFDRAQQERRLRAAERGLALLGKVNPLALEEFTALEERLRFLTEQVEDLKRSRQDLMEIIREVDERVERVFTEAYEDTAREFERVFARLFPGGDGRLVLTDPDSMLTTGVDVEARPPGKKVKRLSLLSGGERSLTAVAFLIALFKARPSPFYVLDEVEAALDDVNLGRLIDAIDELRTSSQLIVVTHQKRTMEIADALYGVSMRGDGVTQVVGQRLREAASA
ncbi:MAG: chromosome segregation protein SMC [Actinomycetales bacterium mxb001]|nr:MAG: chromosome segregation protein SMC [Actinomycetales bacterium mxb001]